jgi:hypothetical protein
MLLTVALVMAAMMVAMAMPAFAAKGGFNLVATPSGNFHTVNNTGEQNQNAHSQHNGGAVVTQLTPSGCVEHANRTPSGQSNEVAHNCE